MLRHACHLALIAALAAPCLARAADCKDRKPTTWDIVVGPASEPGERLEVTGHVRSTMDNRPLAGITVYVYHADARGEYNPDQRQPPRLCGILRTNASGAYRIRTSMPGGYGGFPGHIHFEVWGPRVTRQHLFVNLVPAKDDSARGTAPAPRGYLNATDRPVYRGADGIHRMEKDLLVTLTAR
ncbi:MAG TPA: hypothetical protein VJY35_06810 [Candidatus Eisenbacteria bacterium]|nr:hypothetical protein [Candidatus Eisenbacteria bacterium]